MATLEKFKKLKSANSLETNCTYDDTSDKDIKIHIYSPKTHQNFEKFSSSSNEINYDGEIEPTNQRLNKNLMNIPVLSKKHAEGVFLVASNSSQPLQSGRLKKTKQMIEKSTDFLIESMDFQAMNITQQFNNLSNTGQLSTLDYINNVIKQSATHRETNQQKKNRENRNDAHKALESKFEENGTKILKSTTQNSQNFNEKTLQKNAAASNNEHLIHKKKEFSFTPIAHRLKLSSKYENLLMRDQEEIDENRSKSRMKLKDYLYMVQTSGKHLTSKKHSTNQAAQLLKVKSEQKFSTYQKENGKHHMNNQLPPHSRKQAVKQKYQVSNSKMFEILKQQINEEILNTENHLRLISQELSNVDSSSYGEPSNEQLLVLYNLRRKMKEEINKKLSETLNFFKQDAQISRRSGGPFEQAVSCMSEIRKY